MGSAISLPDFLKAKNWETDNLIKARVLLGMGLCLESMLEAPCPKAESVSLTKLIVCYISLGYKRFMLKLSTIINSKLNQSERLQVGFPRKIEDNIFKGVYETEKPTWDDLIEWASNKQSYNYFVFHVQISTTGAAYAHATFVFFYKYYENDKVKIFFHFNDSNGGYVMSTEGRIILKEISKVLKEKGIEYSECKYEKYVTNLQLSEGLCATWATILPFILAMNPRYNFTPYKIRRKLVKESRESIILLFALFFLVYFLFPTFGRHGISTVLVIEYNKLKHLKSEYYYEGDLDMGCSKQIKKEKCGSNCEWFQNNLWDEGRCVFKEQINILKLNKWQQVTYVIDKIIELNLNDQLSMHHGRLVKVVSDKKKTTKLGYPKITINYYDDNDIQKHLQLLKHKNLTTSEMKKKIETNQTKLSQNPNKKLMAFIENIVTKDEVIKLKSKILAEFYSAESKLLLYDKLLEENNQLWSNMVGVTLLSDTDATSFRENTRQMMVLIDDLLPAYRDFCLLRYKLEILMKKRQQALETYLNWLTNVDTTVLLETTKEQEAQLFSFATVFRSNSSFYANILCDKELLHKRTLILNQMVTPLPPINLITVTEYFVFHFGNELFTYSQINSIIKNIISTNSEINEAIKEAKVFVDQGQCDEGRSAVLQIGKMLGSLDQMLTEFVNEKPLFEKFISEAFDLLKSHSALVSHLDVDNWVNKVSLTLTNPLEKLMTNNFKKNIIASLQELSAAINHCKTRNILEPPPKPRQIVVDPCHESVKEFTNKIHEINMVLMKLK